MATRLPWQEASGSSLYVSWRQVQWMHDKEETLKAVQSAMGV